MDEKFLKEDNTFDFSKISKTGIPEKYGVTNCYQLVQTSFPALLAKL